ncbi:glycosyltransferase [Persicirhabdus sediminis]|uniref:Glycosyltransferase n=1 Tax=Persicirhabdus sediminis TaxID=454144 RepID=A0A8J7SIM6_9BACT|nr:glycosyltransferase family 2 protein [Persicirhabdus sediminis]MBK1790724.1 glycosyltransferase [Persicirhabdus sediminis]
MHTRFQTKVSCQLSIVVPMFNEQDVVGVFFDTIIPQLELATDDYEIVCVNDGSIDSTWEKLQAHAKQNPRIKLIDLSRNFGKEIALTAGLDHSAGRATIPIDCDLQDPPELIPQMFEKWQQGYHVVLARRIDRSSDSRSKRWTSGNFYKIMGKFSEIELPQNVGDFRLIDRKALDVLNSYPERSRFMKGLFASLGFREYTLDYTRPERAAGTTKWNYRKLFQLAMEGFISFTSFPLKVWSYIGATIALIAFAFGGWMVFKTMMWGVDVPGYASLMVVTCIMSGLILLSLGVIGEYLARIFTEVKGRPIYIVMEREGFDE